MREVVLVANQALSPSVRLLRFRPKDSVPLAYTPGQWVNVCLPPEAQSAHRRAYSIANMPSDGAFELAVTQVDGGVLSPRLCGLSPGAEAWVDGPYGFFTREDKRDVPTLFVASGSGLAPIRAMLQSALARGPVGVPLTLLFGCRRQADILWRDEMEAWARIYPDFSLHVSLSRPDQSWTGLRGYVQAHIPDVVVQHRCTQVYVCGLSAMVREARAVLKTLSFGRGAIHTERFD